MGDKEYIINLFKKYLNDQYTEKELDEILAYFSLEEHDSDLTHLIEQELKHASELDIELIDSIGKQVAHNLFRQTKPTKVFTYRHWLPYAAAVLLICTAGFWLYRYTIESNPAIEQQVMIEKIIPPGGNRATITLDNGQVLVLSEDQEGIVNTDKTLTYIDGSAIRGLEGAQRITLSTPRAGQYMVTLSDGTKVWLNASSKLIYPTSFAEDERIVHISGEAYFEVARDAERPFFVHTERQSIQVLGTRFNVQAYVDEAMQHTTLVEGAVMIKSIKGSDIFRLKPGQQVIANEDDELSILEVEPQEYVAWKDGNIILNSYDLPEILRQLERWYDVDFGAIPAGAESDRVFGMIKRDVPLHDILRSLEDSYNTIQFKINGRRVMVSKK
ncbi:MAG TPA: FecR domain-containing protein [Sphingobacterium sp.]|nr:FecR domain-containing protein [Sphingobacterium sp.]